MIRSGPVLVWGRASFSMWCFQGLRLTISPGYSDSNILGTNLKNLCYNPLYLSLRGEERGYLQKKKKTQSVFTILGSRPFLP